MIPRIALPQPTRRDTDYNRRNWAAYADALRTSGAEPVLFSLDESPGAIAELANSCHGICLPGSPADVNPGKYGESKHPATAAADLARENVDELLLQDAHNLFKPILGICFGAQILNVWRSGTLLQDLPPVPVNHAARLGVGVAHSVVVEPGSLLETMVDLDEAPRVDGLRRLPVNSSHHQAVGALGDGLRRSAISPEDGVVEAIEGGQASVARSAQRDAERLHPAHFVLGVQWHPERTFSTSPTSKAIFARLVTEAEAWIPRPVLVSVVR
jgi:putative glutamine amidotransferase